MGPWSLLQKDLNIRVNCMELQWDCIWALHAVYVYLPMKNNEEKIH